MNLNDSKICFIGAGNMASCIIGSLLKNGFPAQQVIASAPSNEKNRSILHLLSTLSVGDKKNVTCIREERNIKSTHFPFPQGRPVTDDTVITLEDFAHKTYVPATEESRLRGAG